MYFLPRNTRFYSAVVHTRPVYRYLLASLLVSMIGYGGYQFIYAPYALVARLYEVENNIIRKQFSQLADQQVLCNQRREVIIALQEKIDAQAKSFSGRQNTNGALKMLLQEVRQQQCLVKHCHTEVLSEDAFFKKHVIELELEGALSRLNSFLVSSRSVPLMHCSRLHLQYEAGDQYALSCIFKVVSFW